MTRKIWSAWDISHFQVAQNTKAYCIYFWHQKAVESFWVLPLHHPFPLAVLQNTCSFTTVSVVVAPPDGKMQKLPEVHNRVSQKIGFLSWLTILGIWYPKYYISLKHDISYQTRALWPPQNFVDNFGSRRRTTSTLVSNWPRCVPAAKTGTHLKRTLTQILNIEF